MIYAPVGLPRTEEDLTRLKYRYQQRSLYSSAPQMPVELTLGFEAHYWQLLEYRLHSEHERRIQGIKFMLNDIKARMRGQPGNTFLIDYAAQLEKRLDAVSKGIED